MPDLNSKDRGKAKADFHVKSVIEEKSKRWRAGPTQYFSASAAQKNVYSTVTLIVHRQATVHNQQVIDSIVQVWIVVVAQRARLEGQFDSVRVKSNASRPNDS